MTSKDLICIVCPLGCKMQVESKPGETRELSVTGHRCKLGKLYAVEEFTNPTRIVTSTVIIHHAPLPRLPVKTSSPIPKELISPCMTEIAQVEVTAPVKMGDIIIKNLLGTGVDIVASRSLG